MGNFFLRIAGAAALDAGTYEDVEADQTATPQALLVILFASLAAGLGASGWRSDVASALTVSAFAAAIALLAWLCWALLTFEIGARLLPEPQTRTSFGELLRTLGFAAAPGFLQVFAAMPGMTVPVYSITAVWMLAAMVVAVRQALDYRHTSRAVAVCALAGLLALVMAFALGVLFGPTVS